MMIRVMCCLAALLLAACVIAADGGVVMHGEPIEVDEETGAEVYLLGADERPADNIYGEQPYSDPDGRRIAIRYYSDEGHVGGLSIFDLYDGSRYDLISERPLFPPFHAWGEYFYFRQRGPEGQLLRRARYLEPDEIEDIAVLPPERGGYSYGTVSPDHRWYAVAVRPEGADGSRVDLLNIETGEWRVLLDMEGYHAKHEQFSRDGRNKVMIQLNKLPDVEEVLLGEIDIETGEMQLFPADREHTLRPTGHETWIGDTASIFFSTRADPETGINLYTGAVGDDGPTPVPGPGSRVGHVAVSDCGRYWIGDTGEEGVPIYVGSFASGNVKRLVFSRTVYDGKQWAHAHPYMTADNEWMIFAARRDGGHPQVYGARIPEGWLDSLDE